MKLTPNPYPLTRALLQTWRAEDTGHPVAAFFRRAAVTQIDDQRALRAHPIPSVFST